MSAQIPLVGIVGRPNAGKSSLFNALSGGSEAITSPVPGTTRDWLEARLHRSEMAVRIADTCGYGLEGKLGGLMDDSVRSLLPKCSAVLMVVNPGIPPIEDEIALSRLILQSGIPAILACNKCDHERDDQQAWGHLKLGLGNPIPVSALRPRNLAELTRRIEATVALAGVKGVLAGGGPKAKAKCVMLGQPNVGKSTLFNALLKEERSLVHDEPGTTRDPVRARTDLEGVDWELVDTAGVGRKWHADNAIYRDAQARSIKTLTGADVAILLYDMTVPLSRQDLKLADWALEKRTGLVIGLNKSDLVEPEQVAEVEGKAAEYLYERFPLLGRFPVVVCSAKNGTGVAEIRSAVLELNRLRRMSVPSNILADIAHSWPTPGRAWTIRQVSTSPPGFEAVPPGGMRPSARFVVNRLREGFGWHGVPLEVRWRNGRRK